MKRPLPPRGTLSFGPNFRRSSPKSRRSSSRGKSPSILKRPVGQSRLTPASYEEEGEDAEFIEMERKDNIRRVAKEMLLIERAKEWLLEDADSQ